MENPEETPNAVSADADISPLSVTAIQVHEIFTALKSSGFSHQDALQVVGLMLSSGIMFRPETSFGYGNFQLLEEFDLGDMLDEDDDFFEEGDENSPLG